MESSICLNESVDILSFLLVCFLDLPTPVCNMMRESEQDNHHPCQGGDIRFGTKTFGFSLKFKQHEIIAEMNCIPSQKIPVCFLLNQLVCFTMCHNFALK